MQDIFWLFLKKLLSLDVDMFFLKKKMYGLDRWWVTGWVFLYHDTRTFAEGFKLLKTLQCIAIYWSTAHAVSLQRVAIAPCKGLRIPKSGKFLLVETVIKENFACRIRNHGLWNSEYSLRNPESHKKCGIRDDIDFLYMRRIYKRFSKALYNYLCFGPVHVDTEFLSCQSIVHRQHHFFKCMPVIPLPVKIYARIERRIGKSK